MLLIAKSMPEISFGKLLEVYSAGLLEQAGEEYAYLPCGQALLQVEQSFYQYLRECFFSTQGSVYCIWQEGTHYLSALRLEPYRDGFLLSALETMPQYRNRGYAEMLMKAVLQNLKEFGVTRVYSHIDRRNRASLAVHRRCGFRQILEYAVYLDGSVSASAGTYLYESDSF